MGPMTALYADGDVLTEEELLARLNNFRERLAAAQCTDNKLDPALGITMGLDHTFMKSL